WNASATSPWTATSISSRAKAKCENPDQGTTDCNRFGLREPVRKEVAPSRGRPNRVRLLALRVFKSVRAKEQALNIHEVARRARVSTATVSRAINCIPTVNPKLSQRVWKVIKELGYYPNTQARALVSGRSRIFGLIVSELTNPFFPEIVQVFETIAVRHHYEILLTSTMNDPEQMESSVRRMIERQVEGVAVMTFGMEVAAGSPGFRGCRSASSASQQPANRLPQRHSPSGAARGGTETRENCLHHGAPYAQIRDGT